MVEWSANTKISWHGDHWAGLGEYQEFELRPTPSPTHLIQYCVGEDCPTRADAKCNKDVFAFDYCVTFNINGTIYRFKDCWTNHEDETPVPLNENECRDRCFADGTRCGCWDFGSPLQQCKLYEAIDEKAKNWIESTYTQRNTWWAGLGQYQQEDLEE